MKQTTCTIINKSLKQVGLVIKYQNGAKVNIAIKTIPKEQICVINEFITKVWAA